MAEQVDEGVDEDKTQRKCITFKDLKSVKARVYYINAVTTWGDRMWNFAVSLFLVKMVKDSKLRLTATYGLVCSLSVIVLGAVIGRHIDRIPRFKAAVKALICQNTSLVGCTVFIYLIFNNSERFQGSEWIIDLLQIGVIITGAIAVLGSLASNICLSKDWVVVIAGQNKEMLASMNATCRRIDLISNICSPFVVGYLMSAVSNTVAALFIMSWNLVSMTIEYFLLRSIYKSVPELAMDKALYRDSALDPIEENSIMNNDDATLPKSGPNQLKQLFVDYKDAWKAYFTQPVLPAGLGLAFLYMTVLAFDGITIGYAYGQNVSEDVLAGMGAAGAIIGVLSTVCYPWLRGKIGVERTGLIGFGAEVICLVLCVISIWAPGSPFDPSVLWMSKSNETSSDPSVIWMSNSNETSATRGNSGMENSTAQEGNKTMAVTREYTSVILLMTGIATARFGLWMADLSVNQIMQEEVEESWRGRINGVQNGLNMIMDLVKYTLVILLPSAETFGLLALASFTFICSGWASFAIYSKRKRHHLLPFHQYFQNCSGRPLPPLESKKDVEESSDVNT